MPSRRARPTRDGTLSVREQTVIVPLDIDAPPATQPWSVRRDSDHAHTLGRLLDAIEAARKRGAFEALGFMPPEPPAT